MQYIGAHVSSAGGVDQSVIRAYNLGANAFAFFTKNQLQWKANVLTDVNIMKFKLACIQYHFSFKHILPHSSYLINLGHPQEELLHKSRIAFIEEINRCDQLGLRLLNVHPGSHLNKISEILCLKNVSNSINYAIRHTNNVCIVIENTAGQGTNIGYSFEQLAKIIEYVDDHSRIGICLDTCHLFASGYDLRSKSKYLNLFKQFESIVGLKFLRGIHINDTKYPLNSRVDRHYSLGKGNIGYDCFFRIMQDERFHCIPIILETPDSSLWKQEINWLRGCI
ncbi:Endonuclease 4 [Buchnera aphidicola (Eriosoma lanigerum)]|uniref:deoxyribonuclease IV n=1 Tax=Buchnera aphidicola TaxID=9 RepID=UPI003463A969